MIGIVVGIQLIRVIVCIRSVSRVVRIILVRIVFELVLCMRVTGNAFSFAHWCYLLVLDGSIITQVLKIRHEQAFKNKSTLNRGCFRWELETTAKEQINDGYLGTVSRLLDIISLSNGVSLILSKQ